MNVGEDCYVYIKPLKKKDYALKLDKNKYCLKSDITAINYILDSDIVEISCKTCKFKPSDPCICDNDYRGWIYGGDNLIRKVANGQDIHIECNTCCNKDKNGNCVLEEPDKCYSCNYYFWKHEENEMPELKPGMVVSGEFKNDNGGKEKYTGILMECGDSMFVVRPDTDGKLKYISDIKNDEIDKILKIKRPSIFTDVLSSDNLDLIWQRKPAVDWSTVKTDTKVLVKFGNVWLRRYFAKFEDGLPYVFEDGCDSFTAGKSSDFFLAVNTDIVLYEGNEHLVGGK